MSHFPQHLQNATAVLFDLDGTLADTAPDMVAALHRLQAANGIKATPYSIARNRVSHGAVGMVTLGFPQADDEQKEALRLAFLKEYEHNICDHTSLFPGLLDLIRDFKQQNFPWGIVTNKPEYLTEPLLKQLNIESLPDVVVCGDTLPERKPHPAPLLLAADTLKTDAENIIYVGDAERDIEAGRAANMPTIAAAYGYISEDDLPFAEWNADWVVTNAHTLIAALQSVVSPT